MKPVAWLYDNFPYGVSVTTEERTHDTAYTALYTADQLREAQVKGLQLAAQRFRGEVGYNFVAAERYANTFDIASELDFMADELEKQK